MEKDSNKIESTSELLNLLSDIVDKKLFPARLIEKNIIKIKKNLYQKNKSISLEICDSEFHPRNEKEMFNCDTIADNFYVFKRKFNFFQQNIHLFDAFSLDSSTICFNRKPITINFLINKTFSETTEIIKYVKEFISILPFTDYQSQIFFNVIFINFFEHQPFTKQKILDTNNILGNYFIANFSEVRKFIDFQMPDLPYYFVTNKYSNVIDHNKLNYMESSEKLKLISYIFPNDKKLKKQRDNNKIKEDLKIDNPIFISENTYKEFKELINSIKIEFHNSHSYTTNCVFNTKIFYDKHTLFTSPIDFTVKYSKPRISDNTFSFVNSRIHKILSMNPLKDEMILKRFKVENKKTINEAIIQYFTYLYELGVKTNLELRKKTSYNIENVSKSYLIKNSTGKANNNDILKTYNLSSIFQKLKDLKKTTIANLTNQIFPTIKNIRLKLMYKVFKSKLHKNLKIECINKYMKTVIFETNPGMNYLIYIVKNNECNFIKLYLKFFVAIKQLFVKENVPVEFCFFIFIEEAVQVAINGIKDIIGESIKYIDFYFIELIGNTKRFHDYTYEYPNRKSFIFIDSDGNFNNFNLKDSRFLILEKIYSLLNKKRQIDKNTYSSIKKYSKIKIPDHDYSSLKYKPKLNITLEKRSIYNDKMINLENQYYVKGNLMINDTDYNYLSNLLDELKSLTDLNTDFIEQKIILPTFTINLKNENSCKFCRKDCGNFNVYYCPYCNEFICEKCAGELAIVLQQKEKSKHSNSSESKNSSKNILGKMLSMVIDKGIDKHYNIYKDCIYHNFLVIMNVDRVLKANTNLTLSYHLVGYNMFAEFFSKADIKNRFTCNICNKSLTETKYTCVNCKSFDIYYDTGVSSGFFDICEKCFKNFSELNKSDERKFSLTNVFAEEDYINKNHHYSEHIYARYCFSSGFYYLN